MTNNKQGIFGKSYSIKNKTLQKRYNKTLRFVNKNLLEGSHILDLGTPNMFSEILAQEGFFVENTTENIDLDLDFQIVKNTKYDVVTAFEIFEHMVAPFNILREIEAPKLIASVPLRLWFSTAYWNKNDPWDRHYHEFEPRQFDMLLNKAGWKIKQHEKWISTSVKLGIRPLLRHFTPRYYIVYCERK
jgi:hypothetical protein